MRWWHRWRARVWGTRRDLAKIVLDNTGRRGELSYGAKAIEYKTAEYWADYHSARAGLPRALALPSAG